MNPGRGRLDLISDRSKIIEESEFDKESLMGARRRISAHSAQPNRQRDVLFNHTANFKQSTNRDSDSSLQNSSIPCKRNSS